MDNDQGKDTEDTTSVDKGEEPEGKEESTDKSEDQEQSQSNEGKEGTEEKLYKDSFGKMLTADQVYENYNKLVPSYTQATQKLSKLEKAQEASEEKVKEEARKAMDDSKLLKEVPPDVKEAIISITKPVIEQALKQKDSEAETEAKDKAFVKELESLETKYPGGKGMPKFDTQKVINKMQEKGNRVFDPEQVYLKMHQKEYNDYLVKKALKQQKGGYKTEETGKTDSQKPEGKTPKTFKEAAKALESRLR